MARSLQVFKDHLAETTRMRTEQEAMKLRAAEDRRAVLARIADEFERSIGGVIRAPVPPPSRSWAPRPRKLPGAAAGIAGHARCDADHRRRARGVGSGRRRRDARPQCRRTAHHPIRVAQERNRKIPRQHPRGLIFLLPVLDCGTPMVPRPMAGWTMAGRARMIARRRPARLLTEPIAMPRFDVAADAALPSPTFSRGRTSRWRKSKTNPLAPTSRQASR
jgi:hypothetical protein